MQICSSQDAWKKSERDGNTDMCHSFARCVPIAGGWWWCWQRLQRKGDRGDGRWENPQVKSSPFSPSRFGAGIGLVQGRGIVGKGSCLRSPFASFFSICRRYSLLRCGTGTVHFWGVEMWALQQQQHGVLPCTDCSESWGVELAHHGVSVRHRFPSELKKRTISANNKDNLCFPQQKLKERSLFPFVEFGSVTPLL